MQRRGFVYAWFRYMKRLCLHLRYMAVRETHIHDYLYYVPTFPYMAVRETYVHDYLYYVYVEPAPYAQLIYI